MAALDFDFTKGALDPRIVVTRASAATFFDRSGTLQSANNNVPRFNYDPTTVDVRAPHNLVPWSDDLTKAGKGAGATATVTQASIPTGSNIAWTLNGLGPGGGASTYAIEVNTTYIVIVDIQWVAGPNAGAINLFNGVGSNVSPTFTLPTDGTWTTQTWAANVGSNINVSNFPNAAIVQNGGSTALWNVRRWRVTKQVQTEYVQTIGVAVPPSYVPLGILVEEARTNNVRNSIAAGAVAGTPGTAPTNWAHSTDAGVSKQIVGVGTEDGIPYIDFRWFGTTTGAGSILVDFETTTQVAATNGQTWSQACFVRLVGGSLANLNGFSLSVVERDGAGALLGGGGATNFTPTAAPMRTQRAINTKTLSQVGTAFVLPRLASGVATTVVIDVTLRIGLPQLEQGGFASTPILTSGAAVTRAGEAPSLALAGTRISANPDGLTIIGKARTAPAVDASAVQQVLSIDNGSSTNSVEYRRTQSAILESPVRAGGVSAFFSPMLTSAPNNFDHTFWLAVATNDIAGQVTGQTRRANITTQAMPSGLTTLRIGTSVGVVNWWNSTIARLIIYPRRISDTQAAALAAAL